MKKVSILVLVLALVVSMIPLASGSSGWDGPCIHTSRTILQSQKTSSVAQNGSSTHHTRKYHEKYRCNECGSTFWDDRWEPEAHSWSGWTIIRYPSGNDHGAIRRKCNTCGQTQTKPCY